jgi:hypothetical protein
MSQTFDIYTSLDKDSEAVAIANKWQTWVEAKQSWENRYQETLQYLYATSTDEIYSQAGTREDYASNTHIPKLTQIYDLLCTYYGEALFSLSDYIEWDAESSDTLSLVKRKKIKDFVKYMLDKGGFREKTLKLLQDYVAAGNPFVMPEWHQEYKVGANGQSSLVWEGAVARVIDPLDIVFDPTCKDFAHSPKIIRSVVSIGDLKLMSENKPEMKAAFDKMIKNRQKVMAAVTNGDTIKGDALSIAGFGTLSSYMCSDTCELLEFYGDLYDIETDTLKSKKKIIIMDRSVVLSEEDMLPINNYNYIFKGGWRDRPNCLWSMSALENLLGMQYRIDFLENKRADCYDFVSNPQIVEKGDVTSPEVIGPGAKWHCDKDADVRFLTPDSTILTADNYINMYEQKMDAFAGAPKEALGFRTPGEKTAFEVQQLMNAATRIFNRQIRKFEVEVFEPIINAMYELFLLKKRGHKISVKTEDSTYGAPTFVEVAIDDLRGEGAIRAVGSGYYSDRAQVAQTLMQLGNSSLFMSQEVLANISPSALGKVFLDVTGLNKYPGIFRKDSRIYEAGQQQVIAANVGKQLDRVNAAAMAEVSEETGVDVLAMKEGGPRG